MPRNHAFALRRRRGQRDDVAAWRSDGKKLVAYPPAVCRTPPCPPPACRCFCRLPPKFRKTSQGPEGFPPCFCGSSRFHFRTTLHRSSQIFRALCSSFLDSRKLSFSPFRLQGGGIKINGPRQMLDHSALAHCIPFKRTKRENYRWHGYAQNPQKSFTRHFGFGGCASRGAIINAACREAGGTHARDFACHEMNFACSL